MFRATIIVVPIIYSLFRPFIDTTHSQFIIAIYINSQYAPDGHVVRGPAPLPLALAHLSTDEASGNLIFSTWDETDFRTEGKPWWI